MKKKRGPPKKRRYEQGARAEAAEATARRICDAFVARLLAQWFDEITLDVVAHDAGVAVQTVMRRFGGKEGLLAAAVPVLEKDILSTRSAPPGDRAAQLRNLLADYERTGDAIIRILALETRHPCLGECLEAGRRSHRSWTEETFARELAAMPPAARARASDALVVATDVYTWKLLRRDMGRGAEETLSAMERIARAVAGEFAAPAARGEKR